MKKMPGSNTVRNMGRCLARANHNIARTSTSNVALEPPRAISAEQLRSGVHGWFRQKREKQEPLVSVVSVPSFLHKQHVLSASQHSRCSDPHSHLSALCRRLCFCQAH